MTDRHPTSNRVRLSRIGDHCAGHVGHTWMLHVGPLWIHLRTAHIKPLRDALDISWRRP